MRGDQLGPAHGSCGCSQAPGKAHLNSATSHSCGTISGRWEEQRATYPKRIPPRGPCDGHHKMSDLGAPSVTGFTVAARKLRQCGRTQRTDGPPAGDTYGVETMSLFRRHARAEYGHGAGQSRAAILRNGPHQTQCELNDAELEGSRRRNGSSGRRRCGETAATAKFT